MLVYVDVEPRRNLRSSIAAAVPDRGRRVPAVRRRRNGRSGRLRRLQDTRVPMIIAVCGYWIAGYGTAIYLSFWTPLAGDSVWIGQHGRAHRGVAVLLMRWDARPPRSA